MYGVSASMHDMQIVCSKCMFFEKLRYAILPYRKMRIFLYVIPFFVICFLSFISITEKSVIYVPGNDSGFKIRSLDENLATQEYESKIYEYVSSGFNSVYVNEVCYVQIDGFDSSLEAKSIFKNVFSGALKKSRVISYTTGRSGQEYFLRIGPMRHVDVEGVCNLLFMEENLCKVMCF